MFFLGRRASSVGEGKSLAEEMIASGKALTKFRDLVRLQGGDTGVLDQTSRLASAKFRSEFKAASAGFITGVQCEQAGLASLMLGGGRNKKDDVIDLLVGLELHKKIGDVVAVGETIATIHYNDAAKLAEAQRLLSEAYRIGPKPVTEKRVLVKKVIGR
jgi:pyrimidine-nucleoside phosphorylase